MSLITEDFYQATLATRMNLDETDFTLDCAAYTGLLAYLPNEGDFTFMSIRSNVTFETVRVTRIGQGLYVERGVQGTTPATHPVGAIISTVNPTVIAMIKALTDSQP